MGLCSPLWMKAIDTFGAPEAGKSAQVQNFRNPSMPVDHCAPSVTLADLADGKCGTISRVAITQEAR
jgi:hypothetical protein